MDSSLSAAKTTTMANSDTGTESHPMNGGDGSFSYKNNSYFQRLATSAAQDMITASITAALDIPKSSPNPITIVDMGCSIGPNTFYAVQNIIQALKNNHKSSQSADFQVFFNDHVSNDFNTLFASLPADRQYYAAGVPGSFHSRLFPQSSLHIVHSSYALQWLSKVPPSVVDRSSPAWNQGRVHYTNAGEEVREAYWMQFVEDMGVFLSARGKEIMKGGVLVIVMPGVPDTGDYSRGAFGLTFNLLDLALQDMVMEGKVSEDKVDSFNLPIYAPSPSDMSKLVELNGCFTMARLQLNLPGGSIAQPISPEAITMHIRAGMEGVLSKHFGEEMMDHLFDRYLNKAVENSDLLNSKAKESSQLVAILKRK